MRRIVTLLAALAIAATWSCSGGAGLGGSGSKESGASKKKSVSSEDDDAGSGSSKAMSKASAASTFDEACVAKALPEKVEKTRRLAEGGAANADATAQARAGSVAPLLWRQALAETVAGCAK